MPYDLYFNFKPNTLMSCILLSVFIIYIAVELTLCAKNKAFQMNAAPLTKQYLFKQAIRIPCLLALFFGILSWIGHVPKFDSDGFNNFILISKLPIGILSLTIPFVAVVNNIHRTIQTNTQIEAAQCKNISDSYYSHFKYITDYLTNLPKRTLDIKVSYNNEINYEYGVTYPVHLYNYLFKDNSPTKGVFNSDKAYFEKLTDTFLDLALECEKITSARDQREKDDTPYYVIRNEAITLNKIELSLDSLYKMLCIRTPQIQYHFSYSSPDSRLTIKTNFGSSEELAGRIEIIYNFMLHVLEVVTFINYEDVLKNEKGSIHESIEFLRKNNPLIFKVIKYHSGAAKPSLQIDGGTLAAER
ncbi:TPA: hypothetical protein ACOELS_002112 [Enterobacter hormaechei subsp. xiangfangensis]